ncbi:MAG: alpha/beta hydrolase-fold protein [Pseudomonadota bacterium]
MMHRSIRLLAFPAVLSLFLSAAAFAQGGPPPGGGKPPPPPPGLESGKLDSKVLGMALDYHVLLPKGYAEGDQRYPVVYWLHGTNGSSKGASAIVSRMFLPAMASGKAPPMILVFPDGLKQAMWVDSKDGRVPMEQMLVRELVPHIDATYRTLASSSGRLVEGGSMGGYGAARLGLKYPQLFGAASMLSAGPMQEVLDPEQAPIVGRAHAQDVLDRVYGGDQEYFRSQSPWALAGQYAESLPESFSLRLIVGDSDPVLGPNKRFSARLTELGIAHSYMELEGVGHSPRELFGALRVSPEYWAFFADVF